MSYGKRRRLTASDDDCEPCTHIDSGKCAYSPRTENVETRDAVSLTRTLRDCLNWFTNSFMAYTQYKFFKSKEKDKQNTDVLSLSSPAVSRPRQVMLLSNETPKFQSNSYKAYSPPNINRRISSSSSNSSQLKCGVSPTISGMNAKMFYGKSNQDCVVIVDEKTKSSIEKEKRSSFLTDLVTSSGNPKSPQVLKDSKIVNENEKNDGVTLTVTKVHFGSFSCSVKGVNISNECFKFLNVPGKDTTGGSMFKFHISIPFSEISEVVFSVSDIDNYLLLYPISTSCEKIFDALKISRINEGIIIVELDRSCKNNWKLIENYIKSNLGSKINWKHKTFVEVNDLIRKCQSREACKRDETVIVDHVCTQEKRKVAKPPSNRSSKSKQVKTDTVIELDDACDVDEKPVCSALNRVVLHYPADEKDSVAISEHDMGCLEEEQFLNDSILGFYLKYIQRELAEKSIASKTYIFSTFFYGKLSKVRRNEDMSRPIQERVYDRVKSWTKSVDIFEHDFLIIPMNKNYHWFLAIVCFPSAVVSVQPSKDKSTWRMNLEKMPCIIYMDSLGTATGTRLSEPIRHFLSMEWQKKKGSQLSFGKLVLPDHYPRVPYQTNTSDCGLFVLQYVEEFMKNPDVVLKNLASVTLEEWFPLSIIHKKRVYLRCLIVKLASESKMESESELKPQIDTTEPMNVDVESPILHDFPQITTTPAKETLVKQENECS